MSIQRTIWLATTSAAAVVCTALPAAAQAQTYEINIPSQGMGDALRAFGRQTHQQVVFSGDAVRGLRSHAVKGRLDARTALEQIVAGSGLTIEVGNGGVFMVKPGGGQAGNVPTTAGASESEQDANEAGRSEILVTGKLTLNTDIKRTEDDVQPYVVFDAEDIRKSQATTLEGFFKTRLPMNASQTSNGQIAALLGDQSSIDLRGLGVGQTLVLVDGRRTAKKALPTYDNTSQVDINGIPLSMIDRIEVLPSTASGIYGGDATGGVINIITRKDYKGLDLSATYGSTFRGDAQSYRIDGAAGFALEGGKTQVRLSGSYAHSNPLTAGDRDFIARARQLNLANNAAGIYALATPPVGYTSNIRSQDGSNLVLKPQYGGTALNAPRTYVPVGYGGLSTGVSGLIANAGQYNLATPDTAIGLRQTLLNEMRVSSASLYVSREFGSSVRAFVDLSWQDNWASGIYTGVPTSTKLAANAPNNPFTTAITVSFPATGITPPMVTDTQTLRATAGVIVKLGSKWSAELDYSWNRVRWGQTLGNIVVGDPDGSGPGVGVSTALSSGTLDVMRDLNAHPLDWTIYRYQQPDYIYGPDDTLLNEVSLRVGGPLVDLPGGPLMLTGSAGYRSEHAEDAFIDVFASIPYLSLYLPARTQSVTSLYGEARLPLIPADSKIPLLRGLELQVSTRWESYLTHTVSPSFANLIGGHDAPRPAFANIRSQLSKLSYTVGAKVSPFDGFSLRASYGTGFLPPTVTQLAPNVEVSGSSTVSDPKRGGVSALIGPIPQLTGGNPNLVPETSRSLSMGAILEPRFLPGLRLSVDYTRIRKTNEIKGLGAQDAINLEDVIPGLVTRAPLTAADQAAGYTGGVITRLAYPSVNVGSTKLEAFDFQADYSWKIAGFGELHAYGVATYTPSFERRFLPTSAPSNYVSRDAGVLRWRGNGGLGWSSGGWHADWNLQYYADYSPCTAIAAASACATTVLNQGSARIPRQVYQDLVIGYQFATKPNGGALSGLRVSLGIQNLFDAKPPLIATTGTNRQGYSLYGDPRLRRFTLSVRRAF